MNANTTNGASRGVGLMASNARSGNDLIGTLSQMKPENYTPDINALNSLANEQSILNSYQSKAAERQTDPNLAATRALQQQDVKNTYENAVNGNIPTALKNQFIRAGLTEGLTTTGNVAPGTQGLSNLGNVFGNNFLNYQNQIRQMAGQYLNDNPQQSAGLDPGSALNLTVQGKQNNVNTNNAFRQNLAQAMVNNQGNQSNMANSMFSGALNEGAANAASKGALQGAWIGALGNVVGGLAKI